MSPGKRDEDRAAAGPEIAVVVASHDRPLRLRWLLNALEDQTLPRERWELIVAHDSSGPETEELLRDHPLARAGALRHLSFEPGRGSIGKLRNAGWRAARAPLIAFTDDDCKPPPSWLERALTAARRHPGAIVQGMTRPDPVEEGPGSAPWRHTQTVNPPEPWAQACNIVYPRELLERVDGFLEDPALSVGEDTELAIRARATGAGYVGAPEVLTYHAIEAYSLPRMLRGLWRWQDLPFLVRTHPEVRSHFPLWIFWKRTHVWFPFAVAGALLGRRRPAYAALCLPWLIHSTPRWGKGEPRGRIRELTELPGRAAIDATELAALARGSLKYRTLLL